MAYELYMGNILCPVTPSKIQLKIKNQNKTMNLVNGTEVNVLKDAGLTEISYDLLLPNVEYPKSLATYKNGFVNAKYFLDEFEKLKTEKKPFIFKLLRTLPSGVALYDTDDIMVSLESYTIKEDARQGLDVVVSITLKQFKPYGTKIVKVIESTASVENVRETSNSPTPSDNPVTTHTVVEGDCLWNIAKMYYGNGSKYTIILEANKDKIANQSLIYPGMVLIIPGATEKSVVVNGSGNNKASAGNTNNSKKSCKVKLTNIGLLKNFGEYKAIGTYNGLNYSKVSNDFSRTFDLNDYLDPYNLNNRYDLTYDLNDFFSTYDVDYGSTLVFEFTPRPNGRVFFIPNTSERRVTWKKTTLPSGVLRCEAKIYNNVTVTASWSARGEAVKFK